MMCSKVLKHLMIVCCVVLLTASVAFAEEPVDLGDNLAVSTRAELGLTAYQLDMGGRSQGFGTTVDTKYIDLTVGATMFYDRWGLDMYVRTPVIELDDETQHGDEVKSFDRLDLGTALNYQLTEQLGAFLGYRYGSSKTKYHSIGRDNTIEFDVHGPTLGLNYGWVSGKNVFSIGGGFGYMMGDLDIDVAAGSFSDSTSALGYVGNAQYRYLIDDNWDFKLGFDGYYFDFDKVEIDGGKYTLREEIYTLRMGINYTF